MSASSPYPIGTPGQPWQASERQAWREQRHIQREYQQEVVPKDSGLEQPIRREYLWRALL